MRILLISLPLLFGWNFASATDQTGNSPQTAVIVVSTNDSFKVFKRVAKNNKWDSGSRLDRSIGLKITSVLQNAQKWDHKSYAAAYGMLHAHEPEITIGVTWSKKAGQNKEQEVWLCYGNHLFWFSGNLYQLAQSSTKTLNEIFPDNRASDCDPVGSAVESQKH